MAQGERTTSFNFGKYQGHLYPQVYYDFVVELHKNHDDILRAMALAKVQLSDGSAIDFLNTILGTNVSAVTPMEIGYSELLDALKMRIKTPQSIADMERVVTDNFQGHPIFTRPEEDQGKPIFPEEPTQ